MIIYKNYQIDAIKEIVNFFDKSILNIEEYNVRRTIENIFQAITGSGKTIIMLGSILETIRLSKNLCFIWASPGKGELAKQSYNSLKDDINHITYYDPNTINNKEYIDKNELLVVSWDVINKKNNISRQVGERTNFLEMVNNTKRNGRIIILIIDESHYAVDAKGTKLLIDKISPNISLGMSATPNGQANISIPTERVINEGMIIKKILINSDLVNGEDIDDYEVILESALNKYLELKSVSSKYNYNPLVLINIENSTNGDKELELTLNFLEQNGYTIVNGKVAVKCSKQTDNFDDNIKNQNSGVSFLIFKQSLVLGWDCPRASVLVEYREKMEKNFKFQVIGRIIRMPERKHYDEELLNYGYIYTNEPDFIMEQDKHNIIFSDDISKKDNINISLSSIYKQRNWNDIQPSDGKFEDLLFTDFNNEYEIKEDNSKEINIEIAKNKGFDFNLVLKSNICGERKILLEELKDGYETKTEELYEVKISKYNAKNKVNDVIENAISGTNFKKKRTIDRQVIRNPLSNLLEELFEISDLHEQDKFIIKNRDKFILTINRVIKKYSEFREERDGSRFSIENYNWNIPEKLEFNNLDDYESIRYRKFTHDKFLGRKVRSSWEIRTEELLDDNEFVSWWYKNGKDSKKHLTLFREDCDKSFYPDFISKLINGRITILEPHNVSNDDCLSKYKALKKYCLDNNILGGMVKEENGMLKIFTGEEWDKDGANWVSLNDWLKEKGK